LQLHQRFARNLFTAIAVAFAGVQAHAQSTTLPVSPQRDTTHNKSNDNKWHSEDADIYWTRLNSVRKYYPDSNIHTFQRRPFSQPWLRDMGNPGSPVYDLFFSPDNRVGPGLGYHVFDAYRFDIDSLNYCNTTRPYSVFTYQLGSRLEQVAGISHTQNVQPNWNFLVDYRKVNAPGFYKVQRNNTDNFAFSTNYTSTGQRYVLHAGAVYNKEQHDENGGIVNSSELSDPAYIDRRTIDVAYQNSQYSTTRSTISNVQREFSVLLDHAYTWGRKDTLYNADSTEVNIALKPRFSISHQLRLSTEKHEYKDLAPDSVRYVFLFDPVFNNHSGYYIQGGDSVLTRQRWWYADNSFMLNGFLGSGDKQLKFSAGVGFRYDDMSSAPAFNTGTDRMKVVSNYLAGNLLKEAKLAGQWQYSATARMFYTGDYAGDFLVNGSMGKSLKGDLLRFVAGFAQQLGTAPYSYAHYENVFAERNFNFSKESMTRLSATLESPRFRFSTGIRNTVMANYIYIGRDELPAQHTDPFNMLQVWAGKVFRMGHFYLDNELVWQQSTTGAPVNIPALMAREQISYERAMFKNKLKIATGADIRYHTQYAPAGYNAQLNKFFYQDSVQVNNFPELSVFLNFRVQRFRAFIMADQLQQIFAKNAILFTGSRVYNFRGSDYTPVYAAQNFMVRFGFSWVLVN
jgi:hypothetical protein